MFEFVSFEITEAHLASNPNLKNDSLGMWAVGLKLSSRVIEVCDSERDANEVVECVMSRQIDEGEPYR